MISQISLKICGFILKIESLSKRWNRYTKIVDMLEMEKNRDQVWAAVESRRIGV